MNGFDERFDELHGLAFVAASRLVGGGAAEDLAAETMIRGYARWDRVAGHARPWVVRVATNLALDELRRRGRRAPADAAGTVDLGERTVARLDLADALRKLPRRPREVVVLRYLGGLTEAEVAHELSLSIGAVKAYGHRGIAQLRRDLGVPAREPERSGS